MNPLYVVILVLLISTCVVNLLRSRSVMAQASYAIVLIPLVLRALGLK